MSTPTATEPIVESVNAVNNREWIASMPLDVRIALAAIEDTGAAVNEYESGSIFYEAEVDFIGMPRNVGSVAGYVCDAIEAYCDRYHSTPTDGSKGRSEDVSTVLSYIRLDIMRHSYDESMGRLMRWVGMDMSRFDDED